MDISILNTIEQIHDISAKWKKILSANPGSSIFQLPEWHISWMKTYGRTREPFYVLFTAEGSVKAILPLTIFRGNIKTDGPFKLLEFSGSTQSDINDIIYDPACKDEIMGFLKTGMPGFFSRVDVLRFHNIPSDSILNSFLETSGKPVRKQTQPLPYINLTGTDYQELEGSWRRNHRGDIRRQTKKLEGLGELTLKVFSDKNAALAAIDPFLEMHSRRWSIQGQLMKSRSIEFGVFLSELINNIWNLEVVHFSVLEIDKKPVAYHFGFLHKGRFYFWKPAFDVQFENYSPGKILISRLLKMGFEEGWEVFDFLIGADPYKYMWTEIENEASNIITPGGLWSSKMGYFWVTDMRSVLAKTNQQIKNIRKKFFKKY